MMNDENSYLIHRSFQQKDQIFGHFITHFNSYDPFSPSNSNRIMRFQMHLMPSIDMVLNNSIPVDLMADAISNLHIHLFHVLTSPFKLASVMHVLCWPNCILRETFRPKPMRTCEMVDFPHINFQIVYTKITRAMQQQQ